VLRRMHSSCLANHTSFSFVIISSAHFVLASKYWASHLMIGKTPWQNSVGNFG
jgi:hypothetical protein